MKDMYFFTRCVWIICLKINNKINAKNIYQIPHDILENNFPNFCLRVAIWPTQSVFVDHRI